MRKDVTLPVFVTDKPIGSRALFIGKKAQTSGLTALRSVKNHTPQRDGRCVKTAEIFSLNIQNRFNRMKRQRQDFR